MEQRARFDIGAVEVTPAPATVLATSGHQVAYDMRPGRAGCHAPYRTVVVVRQSLPKAAN
jgi:hypothetical protein